jgi:hypothetical protein
MCTLHSGLPEKAQKPQGRLVPTCAKTHKKLKNTKRSMYQYTKDFFYPTDGPQDVRGDMSAPVTGTLTTQMADPLHLVVMLLDELLSSLLTNERRFALINI